MMIVRALSFILAMLTLATAIPVRAQVGLPDAIYHWTENGMGWPHREWSIDAKGAVKIKGERCKGCRWHAPYHSEHQVDPALYREIAALLDLATLRAAASSPCTLPGADRIAPVESFSRYTGATAIEDRVTLLTDCVSPNMNIALAGISKAHAIIAKIEGRK